MIENTKQFDGLFFKLVMTGLVSVLVSTMVVVWVVKSVSSAPLVVLDYEGMSRDFTLSLARSDLSDGEIEHRAVVFRDSLVSLVEKYVEEQNVVIVPHSGGLIVGARDITPHIKKILEWDKMLAN